MAKTLYLVLSFDRGKIFIEKILAENKEKAMDMVEEAYATNYSDDFIFTIRKAKLLKRKLDDFLNKIQDENNE